MGQIGWARSGRSDRVGQIGWVRPGGSDRVGQIGWVRSEVITLTVLSVQEVG